MADLDCPHQNMTEIKQVCKHILETAEPDYVQWFTGVGKTYALVCGECARESETRNVNLRNICLNCFQKIEEDGCWVDDWFTGSPVVAEFPSTLSFVHQTVHVPTLSFNNIVDIQPLAEAFQSEWIAFTTDGRLIRLTLTESPHFEVLCTAPTEIEGERFNCIHVAPNGELVVLYTRAGRNGVVVETHTGKEKMRLQRGHYHNDVSPFPIAFFIHKGRLLLVHSIAWNWFHIFDPFTGTILTERTYPPYQKGDPRPDHYLDYFHSRLFVSPDNQWILDDGWVWGPAGIPTSWNLQQWLENNPWESEDGPSHQWLAQRWYFWNGPSCWIDNRTVAIWGYGGDDEQLIPAALLYDVVSGKMMDWFPGPKAGIGKGSKRREWLATNHGEGFYFDVYLFSASHNSGMEVWDITTGARLLSDTDPDSPVVTVAAIFQTLFWCFRTLYPEPTVWW